MGEVVRLPVRRQEPREAPIEEQREVRREAPPQAAPPVASPSHRPSRTDPAVEPLWRESVGRELRAERLASGRRLVDVAHAAGVSPQYLSEVERGLKDPSSELLAAMAGALGLSVAEIATRVVSTTGSAPSGLGPQSPVCLAA